MNIRTLLHKEIEGEFSELSKMELGSEEYKATVDGIAKLVDRKIELTKLDVQGQTQAEENDLKLKQFEDERKDRKIRNVIAVAGIVIPTLVTIWGTVKSIEFEKTGTITTIVGRGFISKLLPKK